MKKILIMAMFAALVLLCAVSFSTTGVLKKEAMTFAGADSLKAATSADTIISGPFNVSNCQEFLGAEVYFDRVYGGLAGAGAIYFQGRVGTHAWENIWFVNYGDSLRAVLSVAVSGAVDLQKYFVLSVAPFAQQTAGTLANYKYPRQFCPGMFLPYDQVRLYLLDTNWTASGHCHGTWLYR